MQMKSNDRPARFRPAIKTGGTPRRRGAAVAMALLATLALAACGGSGSSTHTTSAAKKSSSSKSSKSSAAASTVATSTTVVKSAGGSAGETLNVGDQAGDGSEALLNAAGLLHKLPFQVKFEDFTSGPPILEAMNGGSVDIGQVGDAPPVFAAASGDANIALVGAVDDNPASAALVVPKGSSITSPKQLAGKTIAVAEGSSGQYFLLDMLQKNGLTIHDVKIDYLSPADALAAFASGSIQAWVTWSPYIEEAVAKDHAKVIANGSKYGSNYSYQVAYTGALKNPTLSKEIGEYLTAINNAHRWANAHPAAWAKVWSQATGIADSVMLQAAKDDWSDPKPVNAQVAAQEQGLVNDFYNAGVIPKKYAFSHYITTKFDSSVG